MLHWWYSCYRCWWWGAFAQPGGGASSVNEIWHPSKEQQVCILSRVCRVFGTQDHQWGTPHDYQESRCSTTCSSPQESEWVEIFLGLLHYYGKFIPNLATLNYTLNSLLKTSTTWNWSEQCEQAFKDTKDKLTSAAVLVHYDPQMPLHLAGDASAYSVGAVISHVYPDGSERPVAYASRTLSASERNYSQLEKEALSLIFGLRKFHQYLYRGKFTLVTDHKPLTTIFSDKKGIPPLAAARLQRWALQLSAHNYTIQFRPTKAHANADGLSRLPVKGSSTNKCNAEPNLFNICQIESLPLTSEQLKQATRTDPILSRVLMFTKNGWPAQVSETLKPFWNRRLKLSLEDSCLMWGHRVIVPKKWQKRVLGELYQVHFGIAHTKAVARGYVWWPELNKQVEAMSKSCTQCQKVKNTPAVAPLYPWTWPAMPWQRIHIDFAGPFQGQMFLIVVDSHSKWPEVLPMKKTTADATIVELRRLFSCYGLPDQLVSDNGPQFVSEKFRVFLKAMALSIYVVLPITLPQTVQLNISYKLSRKQCKDRKQNHSPSSND